MYLESAGNPTKFQVESTRIPLRFHLESARILVGIWSMWIQVILVGMVGIWWEWGWSLSEIWVGSHWHSYQIPTIPTIPPGSGWNQWGRVKYSFTSSMSKLMVPQRCQFCGKSFETPQALNHHISASKYCYQEWSKELVRNENPSPKWWRKNSPGRLEEESDREDIDVNIVDDFVMPSPPRTAVIEDVEEDERSTYPITQKDHPFIEPFHGNAGQGKKMF